MSRWGDEKTIKFVRLYREHECLWDSSNPTIYKNKKARDNAYMEIQEEMDDCNLTIQDIKNKIKCLRSTYHQELNKIKKSLMSGAEPSDVYKPTLSWFEEMDFLNEALDYKLSNVADMRSSSPQPSIETVDILEPSIEIGDSMELQMSSEQADEAPMKLLVARKKRARHNFENRKRRIETHRETFVSPTTENTSNTSNSRFNQDEFYYFGQNVAAQLRTLPLNCALDVQTKIQMLLSTKRRRLLNEHE